MEGGQHRAELARTRGGDGEQFGEAWGWGRGAVRWPCQRFSFLCSLMTVRNPKKMHEQWDRGTGGVEVWYGETCLTLTLTLSPKPLP